MTPAHGKRNIGFKGRVVRRRQRPDAENAIRAVAFNGMMSDAIHMAYGVPGEA